MKKTLSRIFIAAFVLSALMSVHAFADGWNQTAAGYQYLVNGSPVHNEWKSIDSAYYYFDGNGIMAADRIVDGDRYVGADGKMLTAAWRNLSGNWYYFDTNGKMVTDKTYQVGGVYYYFKENGVMATGWVFNGSGTWYYCDPADGHMATSAWKKLVPSPDMDVPAASTLDNTDGTYWFYFLANGKLLQAEQGEHKEYTVGELKYAFDEYGRMSTGWVKLKDTTPAIAGYKYFNDNASLGSLGAAHTGWLSAYPPEDSGFGSDVEWYYFDANGTPYYGTNVSSENEETLNARFKKLAASGGKTQTFLFNQYGNPVYGLRRVKRSNGIITSMYFGTKNESCLQLGEKLITEADGTTSTFYFDASGYGYNGVKNNKLYYMGKLQKAVDDSYAFYTVNGSTWLVNRNGTVTKNYNKSKKSYDVEYQSDAQGRKSGGQASDSDLLEPAFVTSEF